jgi:hypothetical protein
MPESNPSALIVSRPKALAVANKQLRIARQALARIEQERYIEFFATHPQASRAFVDAVSKSYPCGESMIERYVELWNWENLSRNESLSWTSDLIERHVDSWCWSKLSRNPGLPWSEALFERYAEAWNWIMLTENEALTWNETVLERYVGRWNWSKNSRCEFLPWSEALIDHYADRWSWIGLSQNRALPWGDALITRYAEKWAWPYLALNSGVPWSEALLQRFAESWEWISLSANERLPWSDDLIERYADYWDMAVLSRNEALPWSESLIERYGSSWKWKELSGNAALPWTEALIERYVELWDWETLSLNRGLPWSEELIQRYAMSWDWMTLSFNRSLPWTETLIERFAESWDWGVLSGNEGLPWSEALIDRYVDRWAWDGAEIEHGFYHRYVKRSALDGLGIPNFDNYGVGVSGLSGNKRLPWSEGLMERYADRWAWGRTLSGALSGIVSRWSEASVRAVMDRMLNGAESGDDAIRECCVADAVDQAEIAPCLENPAQRAGIDLEMLASAIYLTGYHIEAGVHRVADVAARLAGELEIPISQLQNYLRCWYNSARDVLEDIGHDVSDMDDPAAVKREFERLFPEVTQGKASTGVSTPVQDKEYGSDFIDLAKAEQQNENPTQPTALNPKMLEMGVELAVGYIERGVRKFADVAMRLAADGDAPLERLRPYLRAWYNGARDMMEDAGYDVSDMDNPAAVKRELERLLAKPDQRDTTAPRPGPAQTEAAASLGEPRSELDQESPDHAEPATAAGLDQSVSSWLNTLFGRMPGAINQVLDFDEKTYAEAKPHFQVMLDDAQAAGRDVRDFIRLVLDNFGSGVKPYLLRYANDLRDERAAVAMGDSRAEPAAQSAVDKVPVARGKLYLRDGAVGWDDEGTHFN